MRVEVAASWAVRPNESSGFRGRKVFLFFFLTMLRHWSQLVPYIYIYMSTTSEDIKHHFIIIISKARVNPFTAMTPLENDQ